MRNEEGEEQIIFCRVKKSSYLCTVVSGPPKPLESDDVQWTSEWVKRVGHGCKSLCHRGRHI